jgi:DNA (cytosine-5)-methyltransferase 1
VLGRWLGDGWIRKRKKRSACVRICCNKNETALLAEKLAETGLKWGKEKHSRSVDVFTLNAECSKILTPWLVFNFGQFTGAKTLPAWIYGALQEQRWALAEGYYDADGHEQEDGIMASVSVSRCLAMGMKLLLQSLGIAASVSRTTACTQPSAFNPEKTTIYREAYSVSWRRGVCWEKCIRQGLHLWGRVRAVEPCREDVEVVDITVADDHSFIADGQVVHNCNWGPIGVNGRPLASKRGETFHAWVGFLQSLGYRVDWRVLCAADYGDPTTRRRLFVQAVRGRRRLRWPAPTHTSDPGAELFGGKLPWRAAREIIDWSLEGESIFARKRPLSPKTLARIWHGLRKYGLGLYLVHLRGAGTSADVGCPAPTVTGGGTHLGVSRPFLMQVNHDGDPERGRGVEPPLYTVTADGHQNLVQGILVPHFGEREGQEPRTHAVDARAATVTTQGRISLAEPFLIKFYRSGTIQSTQEPFCTLTTNARFGLAQPVVEVKGERYLLDVRFRMLQPHELAGAQGFSQGYRFAGNKTEQVRQIGNAVPPGLSRALVKAVLEEVAA